MNWREFWNRDTPIYVNERHKTLHYQGIARDIARLIPGREAHVLDHGCGEALSADRVAARCARLYLCDAASLVRGRLTARFAREPKIAVLAPEEGAGVPDGSLDLIVANSLLQYLSLDELRECLGLWRVKLKPTGQLVLADVIPHGVSPLTDARALLAFGWKGGFAGAALIGLVRTALSDYRRIRNELGLSQYDEVALREILAAAGFKAERSAWNVGHNPARMTMVARRSDAGAEDEA